MPLPDTRDNNFLAKALDEQGMAAPVDVVLGEDTLDEMCLASIGLVYPNPAKFGVTADAGAPAVDASDAGGAGAASTSDSGPQDAGSFVTLDDSAVP